MSKYSFKPYRTIFPELFQREKERIVSHIKEDLIVEHVGSTAVPDLGGKGIIDIAIAVDPQNFDAISTQLQKLGYEFRRVHSTPDRLFFRIDLPDSEEGVRRYHIHLTYLTSKDWKDLIFFRDYLRAHPHKAQEYAELKKKAAEEANGVGEKYRKLKDHFFHEVLH